MSFKDLHAAFEGKKKRGKKAHIKPDQHTCKHKPTHPHKNTQIRSIDAMRDSVTSP